MNITLSIDENLLQKSRETALAMGKSLNQMIREYLEQVTQQTSKQADIDQFFALSEQSQGHSGGWKFNRDELYERGGEHES